MFGAVRHARWLCLAAILGCGDAHLANSQAGVATAESAVASCQVLAEGESMVGVSPDGEAWIEGDGGMRQLSPDGTSTPIDAGFTRADELVAWDTSSALVVGDNSLWSTTFAGSEPLSLPPELGKPRFLCGDPRNAGGSFVVTTRGLFERRNGTWLRWAVPVELIESMEIRDLQGACSGPEAVMYFEAQQALWEVRYGEVASFREAADLTNVTATGPDVRVGFVALRDGELIRFDGDGWVGIPFDEGSVTVMSVADSVLWASVGAELYRRDRFEKWERLETNMWPTPITAIEGYAAGSAWVVRPGQLCHVAHRDTLRVRGVRPYQRLAVGSVLSFSASGDPAMGSALTARLDGRALPMSGSDGSWTLTEAQALGSGWHSLALDVAAPEGVVQRTVKFLVEGEGTDSPPPPPDPTVSWERDIRPLYEASCAVCHGEDGNQTFLGSYEAFSALGELALDLVSRGEMPPASAGGQAEPLDAAEVGLLETWVQEGMGP
jgi:mono/diheme cytochrome c family protein